MDDTYDDCETPSVLRSPSFVPALLVLLECDRPSSAGARFMLDGIDVVTVGRGDARRARRSEARGVRTLDLQVPGRSMSARHARLVRVGASWSVEDLGSKNGTFVNGKRVALAVLDEDDILELGRTLFRVRPSMVMMPEGPFDLDAADGAASEHATLDPAFAAEVERLCVLFESGVPALLLGESGTGKEVLARRLHRRTGRSEFVAVNCGAIPAPLLESQLFGHVRGAFSGALRDEPGFVRTADGGTLLLDEIADLPRHSQAALLRVLQEREVVPVGGTRPIKVDIRLVTATHEPLQELVDRGAFRQDLYGRIAGATLSIAPLRQRRDDLGMLVAALLPRVAPSRASEITFTPEAGRALLAYDWPLNVRELEQCLVTCVALAKGGRVEREHLAYRVALGATLASMSEAASRPDRSSEDAALVGIGDDPGALEAPLRLELLARFSEHRGNVTQVARAMGKARAQVQRWCRRFGIDPNAFRD